MNRHRRWASAAIPILIASLAVFLRVRHLDTTGIWGDQAFLLNTSMRWVNGGPIPLAANKSSIGTMHGPMIQYLYALALQLWGDILSVAALTALSGVAAVALTGWAAYRTFGKHTAYLAALAFAVSPWSVFFSQLIWNPTMVPIFSALTLGCLLVYFSVEQRPIYLIVGLVSSAVMTQLHPGTAVQLIALLAACLLFRGKVRIWPLLVGGVVFALIQLPFLLYHWGTGGSDLLGMLEAAQQPVPLSSAALLVSFDLVRAQGLLGSVRHVGAFDTLASVLLAVSLIHGMLSGARAFPRRHRDPDAARRLSAITIVLLWFALPVLFYLRSPHYLQTHYLIGQLPAHFLLIGFATASLGHGLDRLASRLHQGPSGYPTRLALWSLALAPLLALVGWQWGFNMTFQDHRYHASTGPAQVRHIRDAIGSSRRLLANHPSCHLVALAQGHSAETSELSLLREFLAGEHVLLADGRMAIPVPRPCAIYLDAQGASPASAWLQRSADPLPAESLRVLGHDWRFYRLPSQASPGASSEAAPDAPRPEWANGVMLSGYERGELSPGTTLPLTLTWTVTDPVPDSLYHFGTYLLTMDGQLLAQSDGPGFDSIQWRRDDSFITWFEIPVPEVLEPGRYQVGVALYTWPDVERVELKDGGNTAFLEEIEMGAP